MKVHAVFTAAVLTSTPMTAQAVTLADHLKQPGSHASVTVDLTFSTLSALSKSLIKPVYRGSKPDPTGNALKDDNLTWEVRSGPVNIVAQNGAVVVNGSASGTARIRGKLLFQRVSVSTQLGADANVTLRPQVKENWSLALNASGRAVLRRANLYGISIRGKLQGDLDRAFNKAVADLNSKAAAPGLIKALAADFWQKICETGRGKGQLGFVPKSAAMSQPKVYPGGIRMTLVVSGDVATTAALPALCPPLPDKLILLD